MFGYLPTEIGENLVGCPLAEYALPKIALLEGETAPANVQERQAHGPTNNFRRHFREHLVHLRKGNKHNFTDC
jgi:hypothetical protein